MGSKDWIDNVTVVLKYGTSEDQIGYVKGMNSPFSLQGSSNVLIKRSQSAIRSHVAGDPGRTLSGCRCRRGLRLEWRTFNGFLSLRFVGRSCSRSYGTVDWSGWTIWARDGFGRTACDWYHQLEWWRTRQARQVKGTGRRRRPCRRDSRRA